MYIWRVEFLMKNFPETSNIFFVSTKECDLIELDRNLKNKKDEILNITNIEFIGKTINIL